MATAFAHCLDFEVRWFGITIEGTRKTFRLALKEYTCG